jgi:hypothetical protein
MTVATMMARLGLVANACVEIAGSRVRHPIADRLRAVYTFGQPMTVCTPLPDWTEAVGARLFRYVNTRDLIPALPAAAWGPFTHFGHEYRYTARRMADRAHACRTTHQRQGDPEGRARAVRAREAALFLQVFWNSRSKAGRWLPLDDRPVNVLAKETTPRLRRLQPRAVIIGHVAQVHAFGHKVP